jgi:hypothetical protein
MDGRSQACRRVDRLALKLVPTPWAGRGQVIP